MSAGAKRSGTFYRVRDILDAFAGMGAEVRVAESTVYEGDGNCFNVRYLLDPTTGQFVPIVDLDDDDGVSAGEVTDWERRVGITIPKPPAI